MIQRAALVALVILVGLAVGSTGPASAQAAPTVVPEVASAPPGTVLLVRLDGWAVGSSVTVVLCGNEARRGSEDCDLVSGQSREIRDGQAPYVQLPLRLPPMPCPCVVRAYDLTGSIVAAVPFELVGAPVAPPVGRASAVRAPIEVQARLRPEASSFLRTVRRSLGGPSDRTLELDVWNTSDHAVTGVVVAATEGRRTGRGEVLEPPAPFDLQPGEHRVVTLVARLEAPLHGRHVMSGSVFVEGAEVPFRTSTSSVPWGLVLVIVVVVVDLIAVVLVAAERRRQRSNENAEWPSPTPGDEKANTEETLLPGFVPADGAPVPSVLC